jgi:hypothetical protein
MRIFGDAGLLEEESGFAFGYAGAGPRKNFPVENSNDCGGCAIF